jgi:hypothetical protein
LLCGREAVLTRLPPSGAASAYSTRQGCAERADELAAAHDGTCCFMMARAEECVIQLAIDTGAYEVWVFGVYKIILLGVDLY